MESKDIIIGAGLSGLSCGWVLKDSCAILEKESRIGGLAATKEFRNFKFDWGAIDSLPIILPPRNSLETSFRKKPSGLTERVKFTETKNS